LSSCWEGYVFAMYLLLVLSGGFYRLPLICVCKKAFVILNAVKDLLFAMLLRPVKSAIRSFTAFRMTTFQNVISASESQDFITTNVLFSLQPLIYRIQQIFFFIIGIFPEHYTGHLVINHILAFVFYRPFIVKGDKLFGACFK
jgi:hypothetical protein